MGRRRHARQDFKRLALEAGAGAAVCCAKAASWAGPARCVRSRGQAGAQVGRSSAWRSGANGLLLLLGTQLRTH